MMSESKQNQTPCVTTDNFQDRKPTAELFPHGP